MPRFDVRLYADRRTMEFSFRGDDNEVTGNAILTTEQLEKLIGVLGNTRMKMTPEVPQEFPTGQSAFVHQSTKYQFGIDPFSGTLMLSFRSPALGWLTFPLSKEDIEKVVALLPEAQSRIAPHTDTKQ